MQSPARVRLSKLARVAVPVVAASGLVAGLAGGTAALWPDGEAAESAVPASVAASPAQALDRDTAGRTSRSDDRPALPSASASPTAKASEPSTAKSSEPSRKATAKSAFAVTSVKSLKPGKRWAKIDLNLRSAAADDARTAKDLDTGDAVTITGWTSGEWTEVSVGGADRWVKGKYLLASKPKVAATGSGGSSGAVSSAACPDGSAVESGLTSDAILVHRALCHAFPDVKSYGGVRADSLPEHPSGRALDAMISSSSQGQAIADYARANASRLGVSEVIYAQRIWTVQRSSEGWRSMSDRGSATANHYDHVHVTVYGNAAG